MLTAAIGPMRFAFAGAWHGVLERQPATPLGRFDGVDVSAVRVGELYVLVVDHRRDPDRPARVEVWLPAEPHEGVRALVVAAEAARVSAPGPALTLGEYVDRAERPRAAQRTPAVAAR